MIFIQIVVLLIIFVSIIFLKYVEPLLFKYKVANNNEHGSAKFASKEEIKAMFSKEPIRRIKEVGFPILFDRGLNHVWFDNETPHWVYLGSSGSGKSVTQVIPECTFISSAKNKRSVFITDPKGEIYFATSKMFKDRGYKVISIDFRNPELSNHINILEPVINEFENYMRYEQLSLETMDAVEKTKYNNMAMSSYAETNRLITSLSEMIMKEKAEPKDPFWNNSARQLLEGIIGLFLEEYKDKRIQRNQITMNNIRQFQNSSMEDKNFDKLKFYIESKSYGYKSKDSLTSIFAASENTYKSITAVFGEKMAIFGDINVANITNDSDFKFDCLGKEPVAFYVIVPDEDKIYYTLVSIIIGLLYKELVKLANRQENKKLPVQIDWLLDEIANCPPLTDIEAMVSVARSRGMRFHFFIQSFSQLNNVYGKEVAQIILDNCGLVYLKTNTQDSAETISKLLGSKTLEVNSVSQSMSITNYDGNQSTSLMARNLLTPDEVKQLHHKMIIFPTIGYPIFRDTILYDKFSCYESGCIEREERNLIDLSSNYYTVENIDCSPQKNTIKFSRNHLSRENRDLVKSKLEYEKSLFDDIKKQAHELFKNIIDKIEYKECNNRTYMSIKLKTSAENKDVFLFKSNVLSNKYHLEVNDNNTVIDVHLKSIL